MTMVTGGATLNIIVFRINGYTAPYINSTVVTKHSYCITERLQKSIFGQTTVPEFPNKRLPPPPNKRPGRRLFGF